MDQVITLARLVLIAYAALMLVAIAVLAGRTVALHRLEEARLRERGHERLRQAVSRRHYSDPDSGTDEKLGLYTQAELRVFRSVTQARTKKVYVWAASSVAAAVLAPVLPGLLDALSSPMS